MCFTFTGLRTVHSEVCRLLSFQSSFLHTRTEHFHFVWMTSLPNSHLRKNVFSMLMTLNMKEHVNLLNNKNGDVKAHFMNIQCATKLIWRVSIISKLKYKTNLFRFSFQPTTQIKHSKAQNTQRQTVNAHRRVEIYLMWHLYNHMNSVMNQTLYCIHKSPKFSAYVANVNMLVIS